MPGSSFLKPAVILVAATLLTSYFAPASTAEEEDLKLIGGIAYMRMDEKNPEHPSWMKGSVYSTKDMTLRVFQDVHFLFSKTRIKSTIPDYTTSSVILRKRVLEHWPGYVPAGTCRVTTVPILEGGEPVGSFEFHHFDSRGPKGYLQSMGRDKDGYMQYRIWFVDQIAQIQVLEPEAQQ